MNTAEQQLKQLKQLKQRAAEYGDWLREAKDHSRLAFQTDAVVKIKADLDRAIAIAEELQADVLINIELAAGLAEKCGQARADAKKLRQELVRYHDPSGVVDDCPWCKLLADTAHYEDDRSGADRRVPAQARDRSGRSDVEKSSE